jgi:hypothetical protein
MSSKIKQVIVDDVKYNISQCSAKQQFTIMIKITKAGAAPFLGALSLTDQLNIIGSTVVASILEKVADDELEDITQMLLSNVRVAGEAEAISIDDYQGNMMVYVKLIVESLRVNFEDFTNYLSPILREHEESQSQE